MERAKLILILILMLFAMDARAYTPAPGSSGQMIQNSSGYFSGFTLAGDCTFSTPNITCTKTGGVSFASSATTNTVFASNITSGVLGSAQGGAGSITGALKGNGSGTVSQAACSDLSNGATGCSTTVGTAATQNTGTSGATLSFLNGNNTWSGTNLFTGGLPVMASGNAVIFASGTGGAVHTGNGTVSDITLQNKSGVNACTIATGTTTLNCTGLQVGGTSVLTGNQSISLTGDVTGSGTTTIATTTAKINGATLGTTTATSGNILVGTGTTWVSVPASVDISFISSGAATIGTNVVTNAKSAQMALNTMKGNWTSATANAADNAMPACSDSAGNHLNYVSGTGITCGTTSSKNGTVTSVTFTGDGTVLSSTPSAAVTTSGTLTAAIANAPPKSGLVNNSASLGAPAYVSAPVFGSAVTGNVLISTVSTGTAPLTVSSTTNVANLNASTLSGNAIGTSGATVPLNNSANTWSAIQTYSKNGNPVIFISQGSAEVTTYANGNSPNSGTVAIQLDNGNIQSVTFASGATISFTTPTHPTKSTLVLTQDGTGHVYSVTGCKWSGATPITYSSAASKIDVISVMYDGTNFYCMGGAAFN